MHYTLLMRFCKRAQDSICNLTRFSFRELPFKNNVIEQIIAITSFSYHIYIMFVFIVLVYLQHIRMRELLEHHDFSECFLELLRHDLHGSLFLCAVLVLHEIHLAEAAASEHNEFLAVFLGTGGRRRLHDFIVVGEPAVLFDDKGVGKGEAHRGRWVVGVIAICEFLFERVIAT